jgi:hypothetical protein
MPGKKIVFDLTNPDHRDETKNTPIVIKEGVNYKSAILSFASNVVLILG